MKRLALYFLIVLIVPFHPLRAQEDAFVVRLKEKLTAFYERRVPAKLHLFFNQPAYYPGDTAYFHISFLSVQGLRGIGGRQIIQVALLDNQNNPLIRQQVLIHDGFGYNQLTIPPTLPAGMYTVTAYNSLIDDYDKSLRYQTKLPIVTEKRFSEKPKYTAAFYPEGGNLVQQVSNKIVMTGVPGTHTILTSAGTTVATCTLDSAGLGFFFLTPQPGETYTAVGSNGTRMQLPTSTSTGVNMLLTRANTEGPVRIILQAGKQTFSAGNNRAYLIISAQGHAYYSAAIQFGERHNAVVTVPATNLPTGLARATLLRPDGVILAERLFFVEEVAPVQIVSNFDKEVYNTREKATVKIHVEDKIAGSTKAKLRVRVYQQELFPQETPPRIHPLLVSGELPYPSYAPFLTSTPQMFDDVLITEQYKLSPWTDIWNNAEKRTESTLFSTSLRFSGRAYFQQSSRALPDSTRITFFLEKDVMTYSIYVKQDGSFSFPLLNDFIGDDLVYYRADVKGVTLKDVVVTMSLEDVLPLADNRVIYEETATLSPYAKIAAEKQTIHYAYEYFKHGQHPNYEKVNPHAFLEEEIFGPDVTVNLRDYLLFPDMEETLREIVPFLQHRWHNKQRVVRVFLPDVDALGKESPVYIIDGVLTDNTDYFMSLKPEDVAAIKVVCSADKLRPFGQIGKSGIVIVETTIPDNAATVPVPANTIKVQGVTPIKPLMKGGDATAPPRYPQIMPALYWNPDITTDDTGNVTLSFYTPDNTGEYTMEIDGITYSGKPVSGAGKFNIVYRPGPMGRR